MSTRTSVEMAAVAAAAADPLTTAPAEEDGSAGGGGGGGGGASDGIKSKFAKGREKKGILTTSSSVCEQVSRGCYE